MDNEGYSSYTKVTNNVFFKVTLSVAYLRD